MEIKGTGFTLRPIRESDAASLQKHADNIKVSAGLLDIFPYPYTIDDAKSFINLTVNEDPVVHFVIDIDGEVAGGIGFTIRDDIYRKTPLIGCWLGEQYWGRGIMPEAVALVSKYGFEQLGIIAIMAFVFGDNQKSMRVLEKAGYICQGILKNTVIKNNMVLDEHVYVLNEA